jgi:hypothetical protein
MWTITMLLNLSPIEEKLGKVEFKLVVREHEIMHQDGAKLQTT